MVIAEWLLVMVATNCGKMLHILKSMLVSIGPSKWHRITRQLVKHSHRYPDLVDVISEKAGDTQEPMEKFMIGRYLLFD